MRLVLLLLVVGCVHAAASGRRRLRDASTGAPALPPAPAGQPAQQPMSTRVLGAELGSYSFMAALMDKNETWCGGTLVSRWAVLTAGHCLAYSDGGWWRPDSVRIGWATLRRRVPGDEEIRVRRIIVHPAFRRRPDIATTETDLAILLLARPSKHKPAKLPRRGMRLPAGTWVWAAGYSNRGKRYGTTANWFYTQLQSPAACERKYWQQTGDRMKQTSKTVCTAGQAFNEGVCSGDSGSPLVYGEDPGPYYQVGVLSWGTGSSPCAPGAEGVNWWVSLLDLKQRGWVARTLRRINRRYGTRPKP